MSVVTKIFANQALLPHGWAQGVFIQTNIEGRILSIETDALRTALPADTYECKVVLPGVPNAHSHAFQRAMAGLTERPADSNRDNFWSWRETMYRFVAQLQPQEIYTIARHLYIELLRHGYTSVCEFHYLHHQLDGRPFASATEMAMQHIRAAMDVGLRITMLPVLYHYGGFDGRPLQGGQTRFQTDPGTIVEMARQLQVSFADEARVRVGIAAHSLRAATIEQLRDVISTMSAITPQSPIHLHIAEQPAEVDDCLATFGQRPVEYLASHFSLDSRWNLVHATHITPQERQLLATSSVNIILCPMTEANLGDGFFPAVDFLREDGRFAIGSDSHISVSPWEELRMLEYGQRLVHQQRNLLCREGFSTGTTLLQEVVATGNRVIGNEIAGITTGAFADFISLNTDHPQLAGRHHETLIDTLVFAGDASYLCDVFVGGRRIIANSSHPDQEHAAAAYKECVSGIVGTMQNH